MFVITCEVWIVALMEAVWARSFVTTEPLPFTVIVFAFPVDVLVVLEIPCVDVVGTVQSGGRMCGNKR